MVSRHALRTVVYFHLMGARYHIVIHVLDFHSADTGKLQMSDAYNLMARANIGNFNRNRDLTRKLRKMRRKARKEWKQNRQGNKAVRQARKKFNIQNKDAVKVGTVKIKTGTNTFFRCCFSLFYAICVYVLLCE